jgi:hypothetical protein
MSFIYGRAYSTLIAVYLFGQQVKIGKTVKFTFEGPSGNLPPDSLRNA